MTDDIKDIEMKDGCVFCVWFLAFLILLALANFIIETCSDKPKLPTIPTSKIDSIEKANKKRKESIKILDSIKNDTVEKVKNLSNDSTLDLFRELVRE